MATKLEPMTKRVDPRGYYRAETEDNYGIYKDDTMIFTYEPTDYNGGMACCGLEEISGFLFWLPKTAWCEELQHAFNSLMQTPYLSSGNKPAYRILTLNRTTGHKLANQPAWFIKCLDNYPGAYVIDWTSNPNTGNTDIKTYILPTYAKA
jgi:hypothetical protein